MKVLSLYDGMSCGMLAFMEAGIPVEEYHAYEIDKYAVKTSQHNFPQIVHHGDVFEGDFTQYQGFDFLVGGSPCTYWSIAQKNNRETEASGLGWELFSQYVRALREARPKYFIYENNKSMSKAIRDSIRETFGFEEICINSALVSAQNRQRYYWVGKYNPKTGWYDKVPVEQPEDRGILLKDILDCGLSTNATTVSKDNMIAQPVEELNPRVIEKMDDAVEKFGYIPEFWGPYNMAEIADKAHALTTMASRQNASSSCMCTLPVPQYAIPCEWDSDGIPTKAISGADGKTYTVYRVENGMITIKGKTYPIKLVDGYYIIRKLTVSECKRLQTVPEWYDFSCVSNSQAYKMLGNGWTVLIICHLVDRCLK